MLMQLSANSASRKALAGALAALTLAVSGCASSYGVGNATTRSVGQASTVYSGVVTSAREVMIAPDRSLIGTATGAVLGGIAGSELGGGDKAQTAGAIGGAVLGGIAGNAAGKAVGKQRGYAGPLHPARHPGERHRRCRWLETDPPLTPGQGKRPHKRTAGCLVPPAVPF
jgi:outer membrane lipoprotein SlyB